MRTGRWIRFAWALALICSPVSRQGFAEELSGSGIEGSAHQTLEEEQAAEEQAHAPRHGGLFGDADDQYHYELVWSAPEQLILYVNDEHNAPLDCRSLSARWTLMPGSPNSLSGRFTPALSGEHFHASLPVTPPDEAAVEVAVEKNGQWVAMEFQRPQPAPSGANQAGTAPPAAPEPAS